MRLLSDEEIGKVAGGRKEITFQGSPNNPNEPKNNGGTATIVGPKGQLDKMNYDHQNVDADYPGQGRDT